MTTTLFLKIKRYHSGVTIALLSTVLCLFFCRCTPSADDNEIHFLIPGGAGGGWDNTARSVGEALVKSELLTSASFENMSGGGGGKAIAYLVKTQKSNKTRKTLMVNSMPIITRSLSKVFPQSFHDLIPVASVIADYGVLVVRNDSPFKNWKSVTDAYRREPESLKFAGGSSVGSTDHFLAALCVKRSGGDPKRFIYVPYDAGGKAMAGLLSGETEVLSTGFSEALPFARDQRVRILAVTAPQRLPERPDVPTMKELGVDVEFANWRGFFSAPGTPADKIARYNTLIQAMLATEVWEQIRRRNGWSTLYIPGEQEFKTFLIQQEGAARDFMTEIGLLM
jgi:putative tricarboxylic transport membrane protein